MKLHFDPLRLPQRCRDLRAEVRDFLNNEIKAGTFNPDDAAVGARNDRLFSKKVADKGWIGLTWPKRYGGQERSFLERYVITEEMRIFKAPTRRFFVADRQSGPTLIRYGSESIKRSILPRIVAGHAAFCIGMSEPDSGSDLFAARAKAVPTEGGWIVSGSKIWISNAHIADFMIGLFRTAPATKENRRHGLTSLLIDMRAPGVTCNPIKQMTGASEFNEVVFEDVFVPHENLIGEVDSAWKQATSELAYERSGPERFLETYGVLSALVDATHDAKDVRADIDVGRLVAELHSLRTMSISVAGMLEAGKEPVVEAAIVKDLGTQWEQVLPNRAKEVAGLLKEVGHDDPVLDEEIVHYARLAPKLTIQGGTTEILRGIIARGLGLR